MLIGAIAMACFVASLFFLRFWKDTKDRFFLFFAISFFIEGITRIILGSNFYSSEEEPLFYITRLIAFLVILFAVIDKNLNANASTPPRLKKR